MRDPTLGGTDKGFSPATSRMEVSQMTRTNRVFLSLGILLVDLVVFFLPLTALFLVYIILWNPAWFRGFLNGLDKDPGRTNES
ncbi:MAG: hypothetical protein JW821_11250 [Deltaproteobacteria bacterium]|nr:hypothetical protein [Deltaproteobacteria bacterium]